MQPVCLTRVNVSSLSDLVLLRYPMNMNLSLGKPEALKAVVTAHGPGNASILIPC